MNISLDWLKEYVKIEVPLAELVAKLTMIGLVVESTREKDGDIILELETYANRPDTLGHLGVARELAAAYGLPLEKKTWAVTGLDEDTSDIIDIQVLDEALCPRYCGLVVKDIKLGPSPDWLKRRIEAMGLNPINNIVDVTNYVLFATGQPLHSFDLANLEGGRLLVRRAKRGEVLVDLDGRKLELTQDMLVIADAVKPVALAGVIGGQGSGIAESTRDVVIESACFDPVSVRQTARKLGVSTDASYRFERGSDIGFAPEAARMAASILSGMGGKVARSMTDVYPKPRKNKVITLRRQRVVDLLGAPVEAAFIEKTLPVLGFKVTPQKNDVWQVEVPTFRVDIDREADLVEEVARFYGYDNIPSEPTPVKTFDPTPNRKRDRIERIRRLILPQGFDEVINWSFADPEAEKLFGGAEDPIVIKNPISIKSSIVRTTLLPGLLDNVGWNFNRGLEGVHIFEIGNISYFKDEKPVEELTLGMMSAGLQPGHGWWDKPEASDFFVLKGAVEAMMSGLRYEPFSFEKADRAPFEEGFCLSLLYKEQVVGHLGRLSAEALAHFSIDQPVYAAEINLYVLFAKQARPFQFVPVPKYPGVERDVSFLVKGSVSFQDIRRAIVRLNPSWLESMELVDRFSGASIPDDKVSLTIRFRYRHPKRTLQAAEVDQVENDFLGQLKSALDIQLREGRIDNRN